MQAGDMREEFLPEWSPAPRTQQLPGWNSQLASTPIDTLLPAGIGEDFHRVEEYKAAGKLKGRAALITGGDSGIGRAVALLFAMEGADVAINYLPDEEDDAQLTKKDVESKGGKCILIPKDLRTATACKEIVDTSVRELGHLEILVNNAGTQMQQELFEDISMYVLDVCKELTMQRAVGQYLPSQHYGYDVHHKVRSATSQAWGLHHQLCLCESVHWQPVSHRLHGDKGCRGRLHSSSGEAKSNRWHSSQCCGPGSHQHALNSSDIFRGK